MRLLITLAFLALPFAMNAQFLSRQQLDTAYVFTSLSEALETPHEVYVLRLKVRKGEVPKEVFELRNLHRLILKRGKIEALPSGFTRLKNLVELDLSSNSFNQIPAVIFELPQLEVLRLGKNKISQIPKEITRLENLQVLDLWSTEVSRIPLFLTEMPALREVDLRMIEISQDDQDYFIEELPEVNFLFSAPCNCR